MHDRLLRARLKIVHPKLAHFSIRENVAQQNDVERTFVVGTYIVHRLTHTGDAQAHKLIFFHTLVQNSLRFFFCFLVLFMTIQYVNAAVAAD